MKSIFECWHSEFENKEYKKEWKEYVPLRREQGVDVPSKQLYRIGTVSERQDGSGFAVYDGATNYIGKINNDGSFEFNGPKSDYFTSFLKYAKIEIEKNFKKLD